MTDYIERGAAKRAADLAMGLTDTEYDMICNQIDKIPTADVVPVVHGQWVDNGIQGSMLRGCSVCSFTCGSSSFFYCPSCGAKMDGGVDNAAD